MLRAAAVIIALGVGVPAAPAFALPVSCMGIQTVDSTPQGMNVRVTNNCGVCAKARVNALRDGKPTNFDAIMTLQPNESKTDYVSFSSGFGNYQYIVAQVTEC